jgi:hypothetical protein
MASIDTDTRPSEARLRLLTTASGIFAAGLPASDMLRDGAMAAGCLFDPALICETFLRGVDGLVETHAARRPS